MRAGCVGDDECRRVGVVCAGQEAGGCTGHIQHARPRPVREREEEACMKLCPPPGEGVAGGRAGGGDVCEVSLVVFL